MKSIRGSKLLVTLLGLAALILLGLYGRFGPSIATTVTGASVTRATEVGTWGDSFGAFNAAVSTIALIFIVATLMLQGRGLDEQTRDQHRQRFDASFFELLKLLREARSEFTFTNTDEFNAARTARSYSTFSAATTGRVADSDEYDPIAAADLEIHFRLIAEKKMKMLTKKDLVNVYMRRVHSVSESTVAPYFRLIYSILHRIRTDTVLSEEERVRYANLVRSQLSSAEMLLLGINSLAPISADMQSLVTEFRMLKYLPRSSMRDLLVRLHHPQAFTGRDDSIPLQRVRPTAFDDPSYRRMVAALHAERLSLRLSRVKLDARLRQRPGYVGRYEDGLTKLGISDFVEVARALGVHPALMLRD